MQAIKFIWFVFEYKNNKTTYTKPVNILGMTQTPVMRNAIRVKGTPTYTKLRWNSTIICDYFAILLSKLEFILNILSIWAAFLTMHITSALLQWDLWK